MNSKKALEFFRNVNANKCQPDKAVLQASLEFLQKVAFEEGLPENDIEEIIKFFTSEKNSAKTTNNIFNCLIPTTTISSQSLEEILLWFFTETGNNHITNKVAKTCLQWLSGIVYYELGDISVVQSYYHSFLFLLNVPSLESSVCRLLYLISKPEDARRWVVQQILNLPNNGNPKPYTNALLGLLKSYRGNIVPETISYQTFHYKTTFFDDILKKAHERKSRNNYPEEDTSNLEIQWSTLNVHDRKSKKLRRLIPSVDFIIGNNSSTRLPKNKLQSIFNFKSIVTLGVNPYNIECPAETLSLLTNVGGYHILAFSDSAIKTRFFHKLYHTLCKVFLLELEPYSVEEKIYFLNSLKELQEYTQQSIPIITTFLFYYLPVWDGVEYQKQILGLIEWIDIRNNNDLQNYVFPVLRQIFISSDSPIKCLIIETMASLMRNLLIMDKEEHNCFKNDYQNFNVVNFIQAIGGFVYELITNGLTWNKEKSSRNILNSALNFYETTQAVEQAGDLPLIMVMPPALVYASLFSGSRICVERLCFLLLHLQTSVERLYLLGVYEDFSTEVEKLNIYTLDYYRCFWSKLNFLAEKDSFLFLHDLFCDKMWKLKEMYGDVVNKILGVEYNLALCDPKSRGIREAIMCQLAEDYPSSLRLKQFTEEILVQNA